MQRPVRAPVGLEDRLVLAARDAVGVPDAPVTVEVAEPELGAVPGHARVIPHEPGEPLAARVHTRAREEIVAGDDDVRLGRSVGRQRDQLVHHLAALVALAHADHGAAVWCHAAVGVP